MRQCLNSVSNFADEIIIADGESTDGTVDIAKEFDAKIISTTNKPNFHINKQMAMDAANGEIVLQLDADEAVDNELKKFILKVHKNLQAGKKQPVAWWLKRKNLFLGHYLRKGGQYPDPVIRLYVNGFASLPQKDVHEQMEVEGEVGWAEGHLIHYSNPSFSDYMRKFNTYTSFKASQLKDGGVTISFKNSMNYLIAKPLFTFLLLFFRHKGFVDGVPGFVFAMMSGLHHFFAYLKLWELFEQEKAAKDYVKSPN